ncbi:MAG: hypothetical protein Q4G35_03190 [Propionibacteriaceae bacterium]|nr:hypothetical protein [Propionibacteriaceae bacterium]
MSPRLWAETGFSPLKWRDITPDDLRDASPHNRVLIARQGAEVLLHWSSAANAVWPSVNIPPGYWPVTLPLEYAYEGIAIGTTRHRNQSASGSIFIRPFHRQLYVSGAGAQPWVGQGRWATSQAPPTVEPGLPWP